MAKRGLLVLILVCLMAGGIYARELSIGGGLHFGYEVGDAGVSGPFGIGNLRLLVDQVGVGGWLFADARFVEFSIGLYGGGLNKSVDIISLLPNLSLSGSFFAMDFSLLGKFPLGGRFFTIFPLLGIGYQAVLSAQIEGVNLSSPSDLSTFRIILGVGSDVSLGGGSLFLRTSLMGFYRFASSFENNFADTMGLIPGVTADTFGGLGGALRVGVGFRL